MIIKIVRLVLICFSAFGALLMGREIAVFGARPLSVIIEMMLILNAIYLMSLFIWRPSLMQVEAAARVLHEAGTRHGWWKPYVTSYDEMAASDPIARAEFDGIVEQMLRVARSP